MNSFSCYYSFAAILDADRGGRFRIAPTDCHVPVRGTLEYLNPLELIAKEIDPETGAHLGNFPQAFSHIGIVNSALYLGYARGTETPGLAPMGIRLGEPVVSSEE